MADPALPLGDDVDPASGASSTDDESGDTYDLEGWEDLEDLEDGEIAVLGLLAEELSHLRNTGSLDHGGPSILGLVTEELNQLHSTEDVEYGEIDTLELLGDGSPASIQSAIQTSLAIESLLGERENSQKTRDKLLACFLEVKFKESPSVEALEVAIDLAKTLHALPATSENNTLRIYRGNNYAMALSLRYRIYAKQKDLQQWIQLSDDAVKASSQATSILNEPRGTILQDPGLEVHTLNTLAAGLYESFQLTGSLDDLSRSIDIMDRLIEAVPLIEDWQDSRVEWLGNLAAKLHRRYEQSEGDDPNDLDQSINRAQEALRLAGNDVLQRASALSGLALPLARRARDNHDMDELDKAIELLREAQRITPTEHPSRVEIGVNLALYIFLKSEMPDIGPESTENVDEAIDLATSIHSNLPDDHVSKSHLENLLGLFHYARSRRSHSESDVRNALEHLGKALYSTHYPSVLRRVQAGRMIVHICCIQEQWDAAYMAATTAIELIPKLSPHTIRNSDKSRLLSTYDVVGFGANAAAAALNADEGASAALRLLEMGCGSLVASVSELHDLTALRREHSELAQRFVELRGKLQMDSPQQRSVSDEFDALLGEIRGKPGFETFLGPLIDRDVLEAAQSGPVVVLSASEFRGVDAILVKKDRVDVLNLNTVTLADLGKRSRKMDSPAALQWLWDSIARPILEELGLTRPSPREPLPRIWWIPTGILTKFPFHAAGYHSAGLADSVMDCVVSSYSSSIKALLRARSRPYSPPRPKECKALLVAVPNAPDYAPLSFPVGEVENVKRHLVSKGFDCIPLIDDTAHMQNVFSALQDCPIFHFAGHGKEDVTDPLRSLLVLPDWKTDPMTVGSVFDASLNMNRDNGPFLAYLSACDTGQVTMAKFQYESIHLISACQLAGFRHVIGTLWSVDDYSSLRMATAIYKSLFGEDMKDDFVSRSLHEAARDLRNEDRNSKGVDNGTDARKVGAGYVDGDEPTGKGASWIPFVHFGA